MLCLSVVTKLMRKVKIKTSNNYLLHRKPFTQLGELEKHSGSLDMMIIEKMGQSVYISQHRTCFYLSLQPIETSLLYIIPLELPILYLDLKSSLS